MPDQLVWTSNSKSGLSYMRNNIPAFITPFALKPLLDCYRRSTGIGRHTQFIIVPPIPVLCFPFFFFLLGEINTWLAVLQKTYRVYTEYHNIMNIPRISEIQHEEFQGQHCKYKKIKGLFQNKTTSTPPDCAPRRRRPKAAATAICPPLLPSSTVLPQPPPSLTTLPPSSPPPRPCFVTPPCVALLANESGHLGKWDGCKPLPPPSPFSPSPLHYARSSSGAVGVGLLTGASGHPEPPSTMGVLVGGSGPQRATHGYLRHYRLLSLSTPPAALSHSPLFSSPSPPRYRIWLRGRRIC